MVLALRINVLAKGYSGISLENVNRLVAAFNGTVDVHAYFPTTVRLWCGSRHLLQYLLLSRSTFCVSWVPEKGTVGCSGDLCPLAHLALSLLGEHTITIVVPSRNYL